MPKSMTAFGRARNTSADGSKDITAEIKSVNSRYMDCTVKLPRMYSFLEERIKAYLTSRGIQRGKVEIYIGVDVLEQAGSEVYLDRAAAASYIAALEALRDEFNLRDDISVMRVAGNRELFSMRKPEDDAERDWEDVKSVLSPAVDAFLERREAEGARLMEDIYSKIEGIKAITVKIAEISANDIQGYGAKLEERIKKFLADFDVEISEQRILTEAAVFADKAAIDEELVRLSSHFETFREIAESPEPAGRKLDFLLQEMNRETNTIGSKCSNADIAHLVVDIKAELEKIREQIQNIE
ncbi:MAG: YicC family protein [Clostridia bacterium]|nr:YicC family protein [Clostridia bacterium]MBR6651094.1 YicC family protein [Clostridia bacterium]